MSLRPLPLLVLLAACASTPTGGTAMTADKSGHHHRVDYLELPVLDVAEAKRFYGEAFGWRFTDYGPDYASFEDGGVGGGFRKEAEVKRGGPLLVLFSTDLEATERKVRAAGGTIVRETFEFPGGRRFHFADPSGNELAVWAE